LSGISIEPEVGASRLLPGGLHADLSLGLGYMHYFWRRQPLELKDGRYVEETDHGSPSLYLPLSAKVGYWGDPDRNPFLAPFVTARWGVQGLFQEEVPVVMHLQLLGGVRFGREGDAVGGRR
jgi:hypothetical protein